MSRLHTEWVKPSPSNICREVNVFKSLVMCFRWEDENEQTSCLDRFHLLCQDNLLTFWRLKVLDLSFMHLVFYCTHLLHMLCLRDDLTSLIRVKPSWMLAQSLEILWCHSEASSGLSTKRVQLLITNLNTRLTPSEGLLHGAKVMNNIARPSRATGSGTWNKTTHL